MSVFVERCKVLKSVTKNLPRPFESGEKSIHQKTAGAHKYAYLSLFVQNLSVIWILSTRYPMKQL